MAATVANLRLVLSHLIASGAIADPLARIAIDSAVFHVVWVSGMRIADQWHRRSAFTTPAFLGLQIAPSRPGL